MKKSQTIPSHADIDVYGSLDERSACESFLGKTLDEAEALFRENSVRYQEDLLWMGPVAFRFYVRAAITYVESEHATGDSEIVSCLSSIFSFRHETEPAELIPCARLLADFCRAVVEHFDRYNADSKIYPGLRERYQQFAEIFNHMADTPEDA